ncbi:MAG: hypothetical protein HPY44_19155 [Armatimonadetes bacterium]|nr:hypothetical protein [Armatimonadota bacterium]
MRHNRPLLMPPLALLVALGLAADVCHAQQTPSQAAGLTLQALTAEDLDAMERHTGYRVGVQVVAVAPGSPASVGLRANDVIFLVGESPVASPEAVDQALVGRTGEIIIGGIRMGADGNGEVFEARINLSVQAAVPQQAAPASDPQTQEKLRALDAARAAGILSDAEYAQKRAALMNEAGPAPGTVLVTAPADGLLTYADPQGRFYLRYPPSFQARLREDNNGVDLVRGQATGSVFAFAGQGTPQELLAAFHGSVRQQTRDYRELTQGEVPVGALQGVMVEYTGISPNGVASHATMTAAVGQGFGYLFMLTGPEADFAACRADWDAVLRNFSQQPPAPPNATPATGPGAALPPVPSADPLNAYLDMLDFMRTQAFGRPVNTPPADRQRLAALLEQADAQARQNVMQALQTVPQVWAELQQKWNAADEAARAEQRQHWARQMLLPTFVYPPPLDVETFRGRNDRVVFEHPKGWVVAQTEAEDTQYLYLGPGGTETTWNQVLDPASSPPGALFVVMPTPAEVAGVNYIDAARMAAQQYVATAGANMTEINAADLTGGAIVTLRGRYPGQAEDKFYWVGVVKYGPDYILAGRLGGPVSQAESLVPAFSHMVMTMELNPPEGDAGYGGAMVDYYTSRLGNIVVSSSWH